MTECTHPKDARNYIKPGNFRCTLCGFQYFDKDICDGCGCPRHLGQECPCGCRRGALLVRQEPIPLECGHPPTATAGPGTGYAVTRTGARLCYACCAEADLSQMERGEPIVLYLTGSGKPPQGYSITNWPGSLKIHPTSVKHSKGVGFYGRRFDIYDVWFIGPDDHIWHGRNQGDNQILRCRPTKARLGAGSFASHRRSLRGI